MRDRVRAWRPDVAHVHTPGPLGAAAMTVAHQLGIPAVYTYHTDMHAYSGHYYIPAPVIRAGTAYFGRYLPRGAGCRPGWGGGTYEAVEDANARIFEAARVIIAPTARALRRSRTAAAYADRIRVVATPPGHRQAATAAQGKAFRARFGIAPDAPVVLFVGRISAEKGIPLLLEAFEGLRGATLVLAGPRPRRLRPPEHVVVTGTLHGDEVAAAYRAADVFAFPSLTDTQGIVLHEAALAGLPIVMVDPDLAAGHPLAGAVHLTEPSAAALAAGLRTAIGATNELGRTLAAELTPEVFAERILEAYRVAASG
jgi:glycosyltransferase involved in cell wall biosynthesis